MIEHYKTEDELVEEFERIEELQEEHLRLKESILEAEGSVEDLSNQFGIEKGYLNGLVGDLDSFEEDNKEELYGSRS